MCVCISNVWRVGPFPAQHNTFRGDGNGSKVTAHGRVPPSPELAGLADLSCSKYIFFEYIYIYNYVYVYIYIHLITDLFEPDRIALSRRRCLQSSWLSLNVMVSTTMPQARRSKREREIYIYMCVVRPKLWCTTFVQRVLRCLENAQTAL